MFTAVFAALLGALADVPHVVPRHYDPENPVFNHVSAGIAYAERGDFVRSRSAFLAGLRFTPNAAGAYMNMGVFLLRQDEPLASMRHLMRAQELLNKYGETGATKGGAIPFNMNALTTGVRNSADPKERALLPKLLQIMSGIDSGGPIFARDDQLIVDHEALARESYRATTLEAIAAQAQSSKSAASELILAEAYACDPARAWSATGMALDRAGRPPPKRVRVPGGRSELVRMLGSARFRRVYFERAPLVFRVANNFEAITSLSTSVLSLADVLETAEKRQVVYGMGQREREHRNVWFKRGSFYNDSGLASATFPTRIQPRQLVAALDAGMTAFSHGVQMWERGVAALSLEVSSALRLPSNTNSYITGQGRAESLNVHNDLQCVLVVQLHGAKRWRVWLTPSTMLPVSAEHNVGKEFARSPNVTRLGTPYLDTTLRPGDVLYLPRGALHWTSTVEAPEPGGAGDEGEARCGCCEVEVDLAVLSAGADSAGGADGEACGAGEKADEETQGTANKRINEQTKEEETQSTDSALFGGARTADDDRGDSASCRSDLFARPSRSEWESESRVEPVGYAAGELGWRAARHNSEDDERSGPSLHLTMGVEALVSEAPVHAAHSTVQALLNSQSLVAPEWVVKDAYLEPWLSSSFEFAGKPGSARAGQPPPSDSPLFWGAFSEALARLTSRDPNFRRSLKIEDTTAAQRKGGGHDGALPQWAQHLKARAHDVIDEIFAAHTELDSFVASVEATVTHKSRLSRELLLAFVKNRDVETLAAATDGYGSDGKQSRVRRAKKARARAVKKQLRDKALREEAGACLLSCRRESSLLSAFSLSSSSSSLSFSLSFSHAHTLSLSCVCVFSVFLPLPRVLQKRRQRLNDWRSSKRGPRR